MLLLFVTGCAPRNTLPEHVTFLTDWSKMPDSGHEFYAVSVKLSPDWETPSPGSNKWPWGIFFQLHGADGMVASPPALALCAEGDFHLNLNSGDVLEDATRKKSKDVTTYTFSNGLLNRGHWVEFVLEVVWAADSRGSVAVYRRDAGESDWQEVLFLPQVATLQYATGQEVLPHYWKTGFYRSSGPPAKNVLFLGPAARGTNFVSVALAAFGQP